MDDVKDKAIKMDINAEIMEKYKLLAENVIECIWLLDLANGCYKYISPSIMNLRGLTVDEAMKETLEDSLTPESLEKISKMTEVRLPKFLAGDRSQEVMENVNEFRQYCKDGTIKEIEISTKLLYNDKTKFVDVLGVSRDITERKKLEAKLNEEIKEKNKLIEKLSKSEKKLATLKDELLLKNDFLKNIAITDELTGLYNRYFFDKKIQEEIERTDRYDYSLSMIIFDLDKFKTINDTWGHDVGDQVLVRIADIVSNSIRKSDILVRWGGEEFVILMPQTPLDRAKFVAEKLRKDLQKNLHPSVGKVTASFGVAERNKKETFEKWFKRVDQALYSAKNNGRNCVIYSNNDENPAIASVHLEWNIQWDSGNEVIDEGHKRLLQLANSLMEISLIDMYSEKVNDLLHELIEHIVEHFSEEEKVQALVGFPKLELHAKKHKELVVKALQLEDNFIKGQLKASAFFIFLVDEVIMGHLLSDDVLFFPYTKK